MIIGDDIKMNKEKTRIFIFLFVFTLFCFTEMIIFAKNVDEISNKDTGKWSYYQKIDPIDDSIITIFTINSDSGRSVFGAPVSLVIRKIHNKNDATVYYRVRDKEGYYVDEINEPVLSDSDKEKGYSLEPGDKSEIMQAWIEWGSYLGQGTYGMVDVLVRFDKEEAYYITGILSSDKTATFIKSSRWSGDNSRTEFIDFVRKFMRHDQFIARLSPYNKNPITAIFDIRGSENAINQFESVIEWID